MKVSDVFPAFRHSSPYDPASYVRYRSDIPVDLCFDQNGYVKCYSFIPFGELACAIIMDDEPNYVVLLVFGEVSIAKPQVRTELCRERIAAFKRVHSGEAR